MTLTESTLTAAVVGCGSVGERHLRNLLVRDLGRVVGVESDPDRRRSLRETYDDPALDVVADLDDVSDPDVALVCVPNDSHVPVARAAAERSCHLLVEKPLSHTMAGVAELGALADRKDLVTLVGCNMRFHPGVGRVKELIEEHAIGRVLSVRIEAGSYLPGWHPDRDYREEYSARADRGGGAVLDFIHEIDYARWLFGEIAAVTGFCDHVSALEIDTEDVAALVVRFESGALGEIHLDYVQRPASRSMHVIGEAGTVRWSWDDATVRWHTPETDEWRVEALPTDWEVNDMYRAELDHFFECVCGDAVPTCDLSEGRADLEVALAAKEAARSERHIHL